MRNSLSMQHYVSSCDMRRSLTSASLVAIVTQQQEVALAKSERNYIVNNNKSNNDSEIIDRHTKIDMPQNRPVPNFNYKLSCNLGCFKGSRNILHIQFPNGAQANSALQHSRIFCYQKYVKLMFHCCSVTFLTHEL